MKQIRWIKLSPPNPLHPCSTDISNSSIAKITIHITLKKFIDEKQ